jgi:hypothetical protein
MSVAAGYDESEGLFIRLWFVSVQCFLLFALIEQDGVDMSFKMIDGDEWKVLSIGECFGVGDTDEQCSGKAWARGDGDGIEIRERDLSLVECGANDGNDGAEMLTTGQFRNYSAIAGVSGDL